MNCISSFPDTLDSEILGRYFPKGTLPEDRVSAYSTLCKHVGASAPSDRGITWPDRATVYFNNIKGLELRVLLVKYRISVLLTIYGISKNKPTTCKTQCK